MPIIKFPSRVWYQTEHGWASRPATVEDYVDRRETARELTALVG